MLDFGKKEIVFLLILFTLASFVRFYGLWDQEPIKDEIGILFPRHDAMTRSVSSFFTIPTDDYWIKSENYNYTSEYVKYHFNKGTQSSTTPLGWWLISFSLIVFGKNPFGARFVPLLFSLLSILVLYLIVKRVYGKKYAMVGAILLAFYPFYINMFRVGQSLEPIALFFFLLALFFLLFFSKFGRLYWIFFMSLMFFSNLPKAIILALIFFLWEFQKLFWTKKLRLSNLLNLVSFYILAFLPTFLWGIIRAKFYGLNYLWFLEHVFARGVHENFRFLEVLYSYGAIKQGAFLVIPAMYGVFVFMKSIHRKKEVKIDEDLNSLWLIMVVLIPFLLLLSKQAGAWSHAMASIPIVLFATNGLFSMYKNIKEEKYLPYLSIFYLSWVYVLIAKNMGDLINFVPKTDVEALSLYKLVLIQLFSSLEFLIQIFLATLFPFFIFLAVKYKFLSSKNLKLVLICSLFISFFIFISYSFYLSLFNAF